MSWKCDNCELFFEDKPTYKTQCPKCHQRLNSTEQNYEGYQVYGTMAIDNTRCGSCGKFGNKMRPLVNPMQFSDTHTSKRIHNTCYTRLTDIEKRDFKVKIDYEQERDTSIPTNKNKED